MFSSISESRVFTQKQGTWKQPMASNTVLHCWQNMLALKQSVFSEFLRYEISLFTLGRASLKIGPDHIYNAFCLVFFCVFEPLQISVNFLPIKKSPSHGLTQRRRVKLAGVNFDSWFTVVRGLASKSLINYSFTCEHF